ncbi:uncharacterized protein METZ01_LOCUS63874, partial [marine metagenome]
VHVVDHPVVLGQRASEVAGHVVGQPTVGAADEYGPEVVVAAVSVDRHHRVDPVEEGVQPVGDAGGEAGGREVPPGAVRLDQGVQRRTSAGGDLPGDDLGGTFQTATVEGADPDP